MSTPLVCIPTLQARAYPALPDAAFDGGLSIDLSKNSLFVAVFRRREQAVMCDIDDVIIDDAIGLVSFGDSADCSQYQLSHFEDTALLRKMISTCHDIFSLSLRINTAVRDCLYSGVRSEGGLPSKIDSKRMLSTLADLIQRDLPKLRPPPPLAGSSDSAAAAAPVPRPPRKAPKKCFFCQMGAKKYREDNIMIHPYVPCDFKGVEIYMCLKCVSNWKLYREAAVKAKELILPGETNEELCALCSSLPDTLVLCASCPRSYCEVCLSIVIGQMEFRKMKTQEHWRCMECCAPKQKKENQAAGNGPSAVKTEVPCKSKGKCKSAPAPSTGAKTVGRGPTNGAAEHPSPQKGSCKRKAIGDINVAKQMNTTTEVAKGVPKDDHLAELYYFGQYLKLQDDEYDTFRTRSLSTPGTPTSTPQRASGRQLKMRRKESEAPIEISEDFCLLCKDGGELMECDYVHRIFSETYLNPMANTALNGLLPVVPSVEQPLVVHSDADAENCITVKKCTKVYHTYCLGFEVDTEYWQCPKHYCAEGKCRNTPYFSCDLCPVSFCKQCAYKWGEHHGGKHKYIEIALSSEYFGDDPQPRGPNRERLRIICNACIDMAEKCFDRGEVTSENLLWLLRTKMKSFDPKSDLFDKGAVVSGALSPQVTEISPSSVSRKVGTTPVRSKIMRPDLNGSNCAWNPEDMEFFANYLNAYKPRPDSQSSIGDILLDKGLRERLALYDESSIRVKFYRIVNRDSLNHLVKQHK